MEVQYILEHIMRTMNIIVLMGKEKRKDLFQFILKIKKKEKFLIDFLYMFSLIDNVALTMRAKTDMEILNDATLVTWHSFDSIPWNDSSSWGLITTANNVNLVSGKVNQALHFNSSSSYYQV